MKNDLDKDGQKNDIDTVIMGEPVKEVEEPDKGFGYDVEPSEIYHFFRFDIEACQDIAFLRTEIKLS